MSGVIGAARAEAIGEPLPTTRTARDVPADARPAGARLRGDRRRSCSTVHERARSAASVRFAIYTAELFATGHDDDNRAAVAAVADAPRSTSSGSRCARRTSDADAVLRGLKRHP